MSGPCARPKVASVRNTDMHFLKNFSMIIIALGVVAALLIIAALIIHGRQPTEPSPVAEQRVVERIRPVGGVYAGETGAAAMAAAADQARAAAATQVAYGGTTDGEVIYQQLCGACHGSGAGGAPRMVQAEWTGRIAQGMETLVRHSIEGFQGDQGIMPARGGNPSLTDEQVEATVVWMVDNLQ